ncbi:MAG: 4Fe-4S binding protein [Candidatus Cloacimonetes bacterium]|nr:4Fe-4S binding protein [Candidatus Cloacimonadota bacterium]
MSVKPVKSREGIIILDSEETENLSDVEIAVEKVSGDYKKSPVFYYYEWCKKCGICVAFCPTKCLGRKPDGTPFVAFPEKCVHCETCDRLCPDFAVTGAKR